MSAGNINVTADNRIGDSDDVRSGSELQIRSHSMTVPVENGAVTVLTVDS